MNILAADDERPALHLLEQAIHKAVPDASLAGFTSAKEALAHAENTRLDVAFLDIQMASMSGLALAKHLKDIYGKTNIVFVTGYSEYAMEAFSLRASGYILKPVEPAAILRELDHLRHPVETQSPHRVRIKCFGCFGVFVDGKPFLISRAKPKELLAYLVHKNGAAASTAEIAAILWEDKENSRSLQSNTRNVIYQLMKILKDAGIGDLVHKGWNSMAIDTNKISCDYHDFLQGHVGALNTYAGEYMSEYSWAEFTVGYLNEKTKE